jgi:FtsP/CotA-like multicopper oxidase with cupredoxin domain
MIHLPILPTIDFSKLSVNDKVSIEIVNKTYKFSPDAAECGNDERYHPIFGSNVFINGILQYDIPYGLPQLLFPKESAPLINFINNTHFTSNLHFHGLVNTGLVDGSSTFGVFGESTLLGTNVNIQFPVIKNNSAFTWYHSHAMFRSVQLAVAGLVGGLIITDTISKPLTDLFIYGDNYATLVCLDVDLDAIGCQTFENLTLDVNRSCFTIVNGVSTVQWYRDPDQNTTIPYTNILTHSTTQNIVKFDILNPNGNWRVFYLGVCDSDNNILPFYVIQTDQGICAPVKTTIQFIPVAGRVSILVDLTNVSNASLFFYDYDLTENFGNSVGPHGNFDGTYIFPDFLLKSATPFPSPIPDPDPITGQTNQEGIQTNLHYPIISIIPQVNEILVDGHYPVHKTTNVKRKFLNIINTGSENNLSISNIIQIINNIIYKNGVPPVDENKYIKCLNPNYFYNIPNVKNTTPYRNLCLWGENDINYINGSSGNSYIVGNTGTNVYGVSECCNGANRIYADLWNSNELNLNEALIEYSKSPNNYKPSVLPTSSFRVTKTDDQYINIAMISNDNFTIQVFENSITYTDVASVPLFSVSVKLPPTPQLLNLNIQEWINLLNDALKAKSITYSGKTFKASSLLSFDWSFFPYGINLLDGTTRYLKSAVIKTKNNSNYCIRILGRWAILQMMGKSMTGDINTTPPEPGSGPCCSVDTPCDEEYLYGVYDNYIQTWYPYYATNDENIQKPILCPRRNGQLIIQAKQTYIGLYDGFANDNLRSFNVQLKSTEIWTYLNADVGDSHPLHFHLTSAYHEISENNPGFTNTYSRDIYQIGPQKSISFAITWPFYSSEDTTDSPYIPNIGAVIHCHFLPHNDANSMMIIYGIRPLKNIISNVCFPAGTPIKTDQGIIPVDTIIPDIHTISGKKINAITKTISLKKYLVCFDKNALGNNIPSQKTVLSCNHKLFYNGKMIEADNFIGLSSNIYKVKYDGQVLYNVLMKEYNTMIVNNLICETLHPDNSIVKLYNKLSNADLDVFDKTVDAYNYFIMKNS